MRIDAEEGRKDDEVARCCSAGSTQHGRRLRNVAMVQSKSNCVVGDGETELGFKIFIFVLSHLLK